MSRMLRLCWWALLISGVTASCVGADSVRPVICFGPAASAHTGDMWSDGSTYSAEKHLGWDQDLTQQTRDRGDGCTGVVLLDREVTRATFTVDLPDGDYLFEITAGDSGYASGISVYVDRELIGEPIFLAAGKTTIVTAPITARDGKASITIEGGCNGVKNAFIRSIAISPASIYPGKWAIVKQSIAEYQMHVKQSRAERTARMAKERAEYKPLTVVDEGKTRQSIDLSGKWLFSPAGESGDAPESAKSSDANWHVMHVPDFWKPIEYWIYMEGNGTSHNFYRDEVDRCEALSFDYKTTNAGWYRQWIDVPASMRGKRLVLRFDAVASIAQVYWNGKPVGSHVGMFGPFECEVTPNVKFGEKNLLAVYVSGGKTDTATAKKTVGVAVTMAITEEMINSLAHGCYKAGMAGIWQPVTLVVSGPSRISDIVFRPRLDGAKILTSVSGKSQLTIRNTITDSVTGAVLYSGKAQRVSGTQSTVDTGVLHPKLWSPEHPNLYVLKTTLYSAGKPVDQVSTTVGFKTFEARGSRLYLNGKPYFLRGADMPPHGIRPNDKPLADKFMQMMHDGNTMATRFHVAPPSRIWLDAADKYGVGASVGENWPWILMGDTPIPDKKLIDAWHREFLEIVRANCNHPSIMLWTISNESYFGEPANAERRWEKFKIFSDLIKDVRKTDPQTPIVFHSGHISSKADWPGMAARHLDDSDVDDGHFYFGWYQKSPFALDVPKDIEARATGKKPLISQEASTGYPDNDTGHPVESYIEQHFVPQAWVGSHALYTDRPDEFLYTHGVITKEYAERIRRDRTWLSGWMLFSNVCWFKNVYDARTIEPYPAYWQVQKAWQPVLVSLANPNRHFTAGEKFTSEVYVCNDDPDRPMLKALTLVWRMRDQSNREITGRATLPGCAYDRRSHAAVEFTVSSELALSRANVKLELELRMGDEIVSRNDYDLVCTDRKFCERDCGSAVVLGADGKTAEYLTSASVHCDNRPVDLKSLNVSSLVVIPSGGGAGLLDDIKSFVERGGRVLAVAPRADDPLLSLLGEGKVKVVDASGDYVEPLMPELLDGLDPMDMHWWNAEEGDTVRVSRSGYQLAEGDGVKLLARHIQPHGYLNKDRKIADLTSYPVFEVRMGKGKLIVASFVMADDPLARRFWGNLVSYARK